MRPRLIAEGLVAGWQQPAHRAIDLHVAPGEIIGLTGANGVGKSTLLAALAGQARVFSGYFQLAEGCRLVLQRQEIPPLEGVPLSGRELLALTGANMRALPPWLAGQIDVRLDRLSGGQRHYLALAAVFEAPSDLILLDEPTNNLDAAGTNYLARRLRERVREGSACLLVSHDPAFVAEVCDRVVTLEARDA